MKILIKKRADLISKLTVTTITIKIIMVVALTVTMIMMLMVAIVSTPITFTIKKYITQICIESGNRLIILVMNLYVSSNIC